MQLCYPATPCLHTRTCTPARCTQLCREGLDSSEGAARMHGMRTLAELHRFKRVRSIRRDGASPPGAGPMELGAGLDADSCVGTIKPALASLLAKRFAEASDVLRGEGERGRGEGREGGRERERDEEEGRGREGKRKRVQTTPLEMQARCIARLRACMHLLTMPSPTGPAAPPLLMHTIAVWGVCRMQCGARRAAVGACAGGETGHKGTHNVISASTRRSSTPTPSRAHPCRPNNTADKVGTKWPAWGAEGCQPFT